MKPETSQGQVDRRHFLRLASAAALLAGGSKLNAADLPETLQTVDDFARADSLYHGDGWESLNPGYWQVENGALRRRLTNLGDRARKTGFPYHYETHKKTVMPVDYDPSLPHGAIYRRDWRLENDYSILVAFTVRDRTVEPREGDDKSWKMYQPGYGMMGVAFGAKTQFDSYNVSNRAWHAVWRDNGQLQLRGPARKQRGAAAPKARNVTKSTPKLSAGDRVTMLVTVKSENAKTSQATVALIDKNGETLASAELTGIPRQQLNGWFGVLGKGLLDFEVNSVMLDSRENSRLEAPQTDCLNCYALGTTLRETGGEWRVRFMSIFRNDGEKVELRISDSERPAGGWQAVPVAGEAKIVNDDFRRNTAVVDAKLPGNPADATFYYTVWKDGRDVTTDVRLGTHATGPGTGLVGDVPARGDYVGRLPQLRAPYKLAGLSCHAINSRVVDPTGKKRPGGVDGSFDVRDQPTYEAYREFESYDFQIMVWEDDVWYMELLIYPPSVDDAWKIVNTSICGPTSRWQMMRHWNVINPGDHDYGMDDVKGPEQIVIRLKDGLGQDRDYMRRNFQIVHHLVTGEEEVDADINPKKWRQWKMPNRDFSMLVLDSRLWRTSQDTKMWDDEGWGHIANLYDRVDPTRTLLGEEQFGWLQEVIRSDSSPLICLTGVNGLHTVWTGGGAYSKTNEQFAARDRVAADYAGWVAAGADRVIELLGCRDGVVSVYGDVHNGCIMRNTRHRLYECSFGPIGRTGGRGVIDGFGPQMKDYDGRELTVHALYHKQFGDADLKPRTGPMYWNFLEMTFDPRADDPTIDLRIRNMIDTPADEPRGGGFVTDRSSNTGRKPTSLVPDVHLLPNADVFVSLLNGQSIRATRTDEQGHLKQRTLPDTAVGQRLLISVQDGKNAEAKIVRSVAPA